MNNRKITHAIVMTLALALSFTAQAQNTLRVSNMPGASAPYTTIQSALAAAQNGDIILVEGSTQMYTNDITVTKRITIQGPGYFLDENTSFQAFKNPARLSNANVGSAAISFNAGSAGSAVYGMITFNLNVNTTDITISNNQINGFINLNAGGENVSIIDNYMYGAIQIEASMSHVLIANNYLPYITYQTAIVVPAVIANNIVWGGYSNIVNSTLSDNIFLDGGSPLTITNCTISHNLFAKASVPGADATNQFSVNTGALFIGATGNTTDTQWQLKSGSAASGAGASGEDCGMYGGATSPYRPSGIRVGQPTITNFNSAGTVPQNGTLNIKVSAKVN